MINRMWMQKTRVSNCIKRFYENPKKTKVAKNLNNIAPTPWKILKSSKGTKNSHEENQIKLLLKTP